ncbi:MAG: hypothetical protein RIS94_2738, partial [Pseudomonadota bacterium]
QVSGAAEARSAEEREALDGWGKTLTAGQLHRLWQLLLKGYDEVRAAPDPLAAAQMALLRVMHASEMPDPGSLVKKLEELAARAPVMVAAPAGDDGGMPMASAPVPPVAVAMDWEALVERVEAISPLTGSSMRLSVRVIELRAGYLKYELAPGLPGDPTQDIRKGLQGATGEHWQVERGTGNAQPSLEEVRAAKVAAADAEMRDDPLVKAALAAFPGAQIVDESGSREHEQRPWSRRA